jgi:hypothetical protein
MNTSQSLNQDAAMHLATIFHIFPCKYLPATQERKESKKPIWEAWEPSATNNTLKLTAAWQGAPDLLPGIPVGAHGLVVIDCDRKANGPDGVAAFTALCAERDIDLSSGFVVETPSTGLHFYWRTDTPYSNSRGGLPNGIDVRAVGGFCVGPGAILPDGRSYRIVARTWDAPPSLPDALAALLREKQPARLPAPAGEPAGLLVTNRERAFAQAALANEVFKLSAMREGSGRNTALNAAAQSIGTMDGWIDFSSAYSELLQVSITNGYAAKDGEDTARRTIESGLDAGRLKPRSLLTRDAPDIDISAMIANGIARN